MSKFDAAHKSQLQMAGKISGASWLAWLAFSAPARSGDTIGSWSVAVSHGLTQKRIKVLNEMVASPTPAAWLSGALASGRVRWQECSPALELNCTRIYLFPNSTGRKILAAGVDDFSPDAENVLKMLSYAPPPDKPDPTAATNPSNTQLITTLSHFSLLADILQQIIQGQQVEIIFQQIARTALLISGAEHTRLVVNPNPNAANNSTLLNAAYLASGPASETRLQKLAVTDPIHQYLPKTSFQAKPEIYPIPRNPASPDQSLGILEIHRGLAQSAPQNGAQALDADALEVLTGIATLAIHNTLLNWQQGQEQAAMIGANKRLLQSVHLSVLSEISAQISNNLNNPLTSVILSLELINHQMPEISPCLPEPLNSSLQANLQTMMEQALRTRSVVWDLQKLARDTRPLNSKEDTQPFTFG